MTSFEDHLRQQLAEAADDAPRYRPELLTVARTLTPRARRRSRPSARLMVAAVVIVLVGAVAVWSFPGLDILSGGDNAMCSSALTREGRTYSWRHDLAALPGDLVPVGRAVEPGCDDGGGPVVDRKVDVFALLGLDPAKYLVAGRAVWSTTDDPLPATIRPLLRAPACEADRDQTVEGTVTRVSVRYGDDFALVPPYRLGVWVDGGEVPGGYAAVELRITVTAKTDGSTDRNLLRAALKDAARVRVVVGCKGAAYEAASMSLAEPASE